MPPPPSPSNYGNFVGFSFWTAYQAERGTKLLYAQHGGGYGTLRYSFMESHEIKISDRYLTWGWKKRDSDKIIPLVSGKLIKARKILRPDPKGSILCVTMIQPRYSRLATSTILGPQMPLYFHEQERFSKSVSLEVHDLLLQRLYIKDYYWEQYERWASLDPKLKLCKGAAPIYDKLNQSRLCIMTYNGTVYLETFASNFPLWSHVSNTFTLLYYNRNRLFMTKYTRYSHYQ